MKYCTTQVYLNVLVTYQIRKLVLQQANAALHNAVGVVALVGCRGLAIPYNTKKMQSVMRYGIDPKPDC